MDNNRKSLIKEISEIRNSKVICYICGDRKNVSIRIAPDIIPIFYNQLKNIDKNDKIDLILYTKGGDVLTALRLVELIYEFTDNFSVIVPYKAYSSGTLICLGASEIVMGKMSELSPVDPNIITPFNTKDNDLQNQLPINVEDVYSFISLAKDIVGIKTDESLMNMFMKLTQYVHPLAAGSVYRTHALIRSIAKKLLLIHMDYKDEYKINEIVNILTERLPSHNYMITRKEAKEDIKLPVTYCDDAFEKKIWDLYKTYENDFMLNTPFVAENCADNNGDFSVYSGIIETLNESNAYIFEGNVERMNMNINIINQGWRRI
ncbi:SDH family Clp fold serine proteinase [Clostridium weizhouense]|uniref:Serine dehydrogenase proteinase n=1 Tax=Clostridium weizhouense TaxID=2859781 RepID=A0ABS7APX7_9CLOT|nr:hypothetical protein [Clostridium weizhouense]MBW6410718.1 hypothetical protein [Clostridium weizhouense]